MRYLCCYACVGRAAQCGRGRATAKESEYEVSRRRTQDWWLCCLERSVYSAPLGWASLSELVAFVFHFCSPHRSTPHTSHRRFVVYNTLSMTYELIVQTMSTVKVQIRCCSAEGGGGRLTGWKRNEQKSQQCLLYRWLAKKERAWNLRPSATAQKEPKSTRNLSFSPSQ